MKTSTTIQPDRFFHLLKWDLVLFRTTLLNGAAIYGVVVVVAALLARMGGAVAGESFHQFFASTGLIAGGFLFTAGIFTEATDSRARLAWLLLPCSPSEKFLSRLLITTVGWIAGATLVFFAVSAIVSLVNLLVYRSVSPLFNPLDAQYLKAVRNFLLIVPLFFLGALYFRKHHFVRTVLASFAIVVTVILCTILTVAFLSPGIIPLKGTIDPISAFSAMLSSATVVSHVVFRILPVLFACWLIIIAWVRFRELEG